jgi:GTPase SAR1 family protein
MEDGYVTFEEIHSSFCKFIDQCSSEIHYTTCEQIQQSRISDIEQEIQRIKQYKHQAITQEVEEMANQFLHMQCVLNMLRSTLLMWIDVKSANYSNAWSNLIYQS